MSLGEIARFDDHYEASVAASFLRSHGIDVFVSDSNLSTMNPMMQRALGGIRVMAPAEQILRARDLLNRARTGEFRSEEGEPVVETPRARLLSVGVILGLLVAGGGPFWGTSGLRRMRAVHWAGIALVGGLLLLVFAASAWSYTELRMLYAAILNA